MQVTLTKEEILRLDNKCRPDIQKVINQIKETEYHFHDLPENLRSKAMDFFMRGKPALSYGKKIYTCQGCDKQGELFIYQRGKKKGQPKPGNPRKRLMGVEYGYVDLCDTYHKDLVDALNREYVTLYGTAMAF